MTPWLEKQNLPFIYIAPFITKGFICKMLHQKRGFQHKNGNKVSLRIRNHRDSAPNDQRHCYKSPSTYKAVASVLVSTKTTSVLPGDRDTLITTGYQNRISEGNGLKISRRSTKYLQQQTHKQWGDIGFFHTGISRTIQDWFRKKFSLLQCIYTYIRDSSWK